MKAARDMARLKAAASAIFTTAVHAVAPEICIARCLRLSGGDLMAGEASYPLDQIGKLFVVGAGKASAAMARAVERLLGDRIDGGLVITKYGHGLPLDRIRVMAAGHPVPDENGVRATNALLSLVANAGPDDLILCLLSGGGSALSPSPAPGITLADKQETTRRLLACGATIHEVNTVRKHLSRTKGGRFLTAVNGARVVSLILSDVIGDDLDVIASGMTAPDTGTFADAMEILARYNLVDVIPEAVRRRLNMGCRGQVEETPKPGSPAFAGVRNLIVGSISDALSAAENEARRRGFNPLVLSSMIQGEAREVARVLCAVALEVRRSGQPSPPPACLLSGGETTVTIRGGGLGGRNMELALAAGISLSGASGILMLSAGTDGTDGPTDAAGAFADGATVSRADALGISASRHFADNNSYRFFEKLGDLYITGPTRTNVMDLQILLVDA